MARHIILFRNTQNGAIGTISDEIGEIATFPTREAAQAIVDYQPILRAFPSQIVELDELEE